MFSLSTAAGLSCGIDYVAKMDTAIIIVLVVLVFVLAYCLPLVCAQYCHRLWRDDGPSVDADVPGTEAAGAA